MPGELKKLRFVLNLRLWYCYIIRSRSKMVRKSPVFFGWYIVGLMIVSMMLAYGIRSSFSAFFPHILDTYHWDRGVTAIMFSLNILVYGLTAPFAGSLVDRWKPRVVGVIGIFLLALSTGA